MEFRFDRGARTPEGVGGGSTLAQLRRAYGRRLERFKEQYDFVAYRVVARTASPRNAIAFRIDNGRAYEVRFGRRAELTGRWGEIYGVIC